MTWILVAITLVALPAWAQDVGQLDGRVTDLESDLALAGATVFLEGTRIGTATDKNGNYIIDNVPVGRYVVVASFIGYGSATLLEVQVRSRQVTALNISLPELRMCGESMVLEDPDNTAVVDTVGTISGTVVDAQTGDLIRKATVTAGTDLSALTNDSGRYTIQNVPLGYNTVSVQAEHFIPVVYKNITFCDDSILKLALNCGQ